MRILQKNERKFVFEYVPAMPAFLIFAFLFLGLSIALDSSQSSADGWFSWTRAFSLAPFAMSCFFVYSAERVVCSVDAVAQKVTIRRRSFLRKRADVYSFNQIRAIAILRRKSRSCFFYQIRLVLAGQDAVAIMASSGYCPSTTKAIARRLSDYLNVRCYITS